MRDKMDTQHDAQTSGAEWLWLTYCYLIILQEEIRCDSKERSEGYHKFVGSADRGCVFRVAAAVLPLQQELVQLLELLVLRSLRFVLLLGLLEPRRGREMLLVEIEEAALEEAVLLLQRKGALGDGLSVLLQDGVAAGLLSVEDLHGDAAVVVKLLQ